MTYKFPAGGGGGAEAFTDLTDAPETITPQAFVVADGAGTALITPTWLTLDDPNRAIALTDPNTDDGLGVSFVLNGVGSAAYMQAYEGDAYVQLSADNGEDAPTQVTLEVTPHKFAINCNDADAVLALNQFHVAATDATATMTVDGTQYNITKAIKVKIGNDTGYIPWFATPVTP